ncbi:RNI-like protein [Corynespora cassiicola Philippines]|uniref:RNI-like protein n=1 Tax=Corynespora cassiicola Philippines TaxID=1448308 RepID=A0A2T2N939_CORCC|nr:RNI-like protein [Corynespora cassiicola Philippines]
MTSATNMGEWDILKKQLRIFAENEYLRSQVEKASEIIDETTMEDLHKRLENQDTAVKAKKMPEQSHTFLKLLLGQIIQDEKELVESNKVTSIWLKKNPLGPDAAKDLFRLITETPNLRTLDMDQSELGDVGVARLFSELAAYAGRRILLKHVYLNATGVSPLCAEAIGSFLTSPHCNLDLLCLSNNPMGDDGIRKFALGIRKNKVLSRLILSSVGMTSIGATALCEALQNHPTLYTLDVGQSYATPDLGIRFNWITDEAAYAISKLALKLLYLNLGYSALTHNGMNQVLQAVTTSDRILYYAVETVHPQSNDASAQQL